MSSLAAVHPAAQSAEDESAGHGEEPPVRSVLYSYLLREWLCSPVAVGIGFLELCLVLVAVMYGVGQRRVPELKAMKSASDLTGPEARLGNS